MSERIAALCLDSTGHLPDSVYPSMALRGAVLVDLALAGRLTQTEDSIGVDSTPIGRQLPDRTLAELDALDGRSLDWWLEHSHLDLPDMAADQVAGGSWVPLRPSGLRRRPRFADHGSSREHDLALLAGAELPDNPEDAALICIATAVHVGGPPKVTVDDVLPLTEPVRWAVELVTDFIAEARAQGIAVSSASQAALWSGSMPY